MTGIVRLFRSNCPLGVQKRISLDAAILCSKSEARFSDTAREVEENNRIVAAVAVVEGKQ